MVMIRSTLSMSLTLLAFSLSAPVMAAEQACIFGDTTAELGNMPEYKELSVVSEKEASSLSPIETYLIQHAVISNNEEAMDIKAALEEFFGEYYAGNITYFSAKIGAKARQFALVTYFPGDNEHGLIYEIYRNEKNQITHTQVAAEVSDSDLMNCIR